MPRIAALLLFVAGGVGLYFSMREIFWESRIVRDFVPTPAQVTLSETSGLAAGKSSTYFPAIRYRYSFAGRSYDSSRIWPYTGTVYRPEALDLMKNYPRDAIVTAYLDPQNPADSVLIRDYSSFPYWPAAGALIVTAIGCGSLVRFLRPKRKKMQAIVANEFGWQLLLPAKLFSERLFESIFLVLSIGVPMLAMAWELNHLSTRLAIFDLIFIITAATIFVILTLWFERAWRLLRRVSDLRLMVNAAPMRLDRPFVFRVEADIRSRIQFSEMRARVLCIRKNLMHDGRRTHLQTGIVGERILRLVGKSALPKGDKLKGTSETIFKADTWLPSGSEGMTRYPYIIWEVRIEVVGPPTHFTVTFPLEVVNNNMAKSSSATAKQEA